MRLRSRALGLHGVECLRAAWGKNADQIDDDLRVTRGGGDRVGKTHIGLHRHDLADAAKRLQVTREIGPPHRGANAEITFRQCANHMPPDEAGPAKDRDEGVDVGRHFFSKLPKRETTPRYAKGRFLYSGFRSVMPFGRRRVLSRTMKRNTNRASAPHSCRRMPVLWCARPWGCKLCHRPA